MNDPRKKDTSLRFTIFKTLAITAGLFPIFHLLPRRLKNMFVQQNDYVTEFFFFKDSVLLNIYTVC